MRVNKRLDYPHEFASYSAAHQRAYVWAAKAAWYRNACKLTHARVAALQARHWCSRATGRDATNG